MRGQRLMPRCLRPFAGDLAAQGEDAVVDPRRRRTGYCRRSRNVSLSAYIVTASVFARRADELIFLRSGLLNRHVGREWSRSRSALPAGLVDSTSSRR